MQFHLHSSPFNLECVNNTIHISILYVKGFVVSFLILLHIQSVHSLIPLPMGYGLKVHILMLLTVMLDFVPTANVS
jgi:hypothetical protein